MKRKTYNNMCKAAKMIMAKDNRQKAVEQFSRFFVLFLVK